MQSDTPAHLNVSAKPLSGQRISALYRLRGTRAEASSLAKLLCHEHSLELPEDVLPDGFLKSAIVGRVDDLVPAAKDSCLCSISYAEELASGGFTTLLNLLMGNAGFWPGVELVDLALPESMLRQLRGPRFGVEGLRRLTGVALGPLGATALKPLGASAAELAAIAADLAMGGIDILKEDDGISTQVFAPFAERVERCAAAVAEANQRRSGNTLYVPNITGPLETLVERALFAQAKGATGVEILPGMTSLDSIRMLAATPGFALPIIAHCSWQGALSRPPNAAVSMPLVFGLLPRLAGADLSITVSFGGRFQLSREDCAATARALTRSLPPLRPAVPMPGGGMTVDRLSDIITVFGNDTALLVSGALFRAADLRGSVERYMDAVRALRQERSNSTPNQI